MSDEAKRIERELRLLAGPPPSLDDHDEYRCIDKIPTSSGGQYETGSGNEPTAEMPDGRPW